MVEYDFSGQVAFITGAGHGQGRSHAVTYAENGADVVVTDIAADKEGVAYEQATTEELEETASLVEDEGQEALPLVMDVTEEDDVERAVEEAVSHFGRIDFLANNAGVLDSAKMVDLEEERWDAIVDTNLKGVWLCSKHVGRHFIERGEGGKIVSTASNGAFRGSIGRAGHYNAAKWGIRGITKTLAIELGEHGVNVNAVAPSGVGTPMIQSMSQLHGEELFEQMQELSGRSNLLNPGELIEPRDVSEAYMWLSSEAARYVTGITLPVDAGDTAK